MHCCETDRLTKKKKINSNACGIRVINKSIGKWTIIYVASNNNGNNNNNNKKPLRNECASEFDVFFSFHSFIHTGENYFHCISLYILRL